MDIETAGVMQKHGLKIDKEKTPFGDYEYIDAKAFKFPQKELIRIANRENMPIFSQMHKVFPVGKTFMDFVKKK
jgi:hypothetical protein